MGTNYFQKNNNNGLSDIQEKLYEHVISKKQIKSTIMILSINMQNFRLSEILLKKNKYNRLQ